MEGELPAILKALESLGLAFAQKEMWVLLGVGLLSGYVLGRFARLALPWIALFYGVAFLFGRADLETFVQLVDAAFRNAWALLSGLPVGLSLGGLLGFLSGLSDRYG